MSIAQLDFDSEKMEDAEATVDRILKRDKGHMIANFMRGRLYLLKKDFTNALERFDRVIKKKPDYAEAYYFKALCLIGKRERKLARKDLFKAVELNPRLVDARLVLAEFYLREWNQNLAREQIESALKLAPNHAKAFMLKGDLKVLERDGEAAEATFKKVVQLKPDYAPGYMRLGALYNLTGRQSDALKCFKTALQLDSQQTHALVFLVGNYIQEEKFGEALQICEKVKQNIGENPSKLGLINYLEGKIYMAYWDSRMAQQQFEEAIKTDPNTIAPYEALARVYFRDERSEEAVSLYKSILRKDPKYLAGYMTLGSIYDVERERDIAETYYRKALKIKKDFAPAANNLAWNLAEKGANIDEALAFAQIAKENMPESAAVKDTLGWIYYLKGSYLDAIEELQDGVVLDPNNPVVHYHLGLAFYMNDQLSVAKNVLEKALQIDRDFKGAEEANTILAEIKASAKVN